MFNLKDKVIIVTGSTQGLGEDIARLAAELDAAGLVICGRNAANGARVAAELNALGTPTHYVQADFANVDDCRAVVRACDDHFGRVDGLVNSAAVTDRGTLDDTTVELWESIFAVNTRAPFLLMQESVRVMKREGRGGSIVNILSINVHGGQPKLVAYSASKAALAAITKNAANSLRYDRIRVSGLNVGWMYTPAEDAIQRWEGQPENWLELADAAAPFGRLLRPRDVSGIAAFLLSDAASMMTGAVFDVDQLTTGPKD
jgi:NAD(P)-dependent dehydrogenase (short-subunit alcohol dehydrogenase family)